jgi:hypothetical protein
LQMDAENEVMYITEEQYEALPSSKNCDWRTYIIIS